MKKLTALLLAIALLLGCAVALADNIKMDTLTFQFVPSKDADVIITGTKDLPDLIKAEMANLGYDIGEVQISVGTSYEATGEAMTAGTIDQRFGKLKIEATSFTISEPTTDLEISPMIYDLATDEEQRILRELYDVSPFSIMTITMERIFIDKVFAAEAYVRRSAEPQRAFEAAKHIYDLAVMIHQPNIQSLLTNETLTKKLLDIRFEEEAGRLDGIPGVLPKEFTFFDTVSANDTVRKVYAIMQSQYVLRPSDRIEYDAAMNSLSVISNKLQQNTAWIHYKPSEELLQRIAQFVEERNRPEPKKRIDFER